jgi:hypothetical protein
VLTSDTVSAAAERAIPVAMPRPARTARPRRGRGAYGSRGGLYGGAGGGGVNPCGGADGIGAGYAPYPCVVESGFIVSPAVIHQGYGQCRWPSAAISGSARTLNIPLTARTTAAGLVLRWGAAKFVHEALTGVR